ncbi:iclR family transcriptional regulator [Planomonospora sphaerica]|uniref:Glycerol operon regulatory protein n=1 Tax=Planomonospora sphaerica TaxID=161355 RepID=A0A171CJM3_9ACTN|nr:MULTISPECIES: IclR family transcriptional regulator [Planomonospora]GAT66806.1 iclR family transcriptional regulator [Planomonospora sphaerica]GGL01876.1 IclR family transcriptional regulator [Planomonospora parontospora subsp. antibiotica]GII16821.1 IclR family transcriptional regulator [Planomonospora parontospora subsp. antibiotica]
MSGTGGAMGTVQSVDRALDLLEALAGRGGEAGISELSAATGLPYGTIHRLLRTLLARGYVRQESDRRYALGGALVRLGGVAERMVGAWAQPYLEKMVALSGETANLAVLEGDFIVYVAQVPSPRRLRMFAEVGRRVLPHSTAVGKVLLADRPAGEVAALVERTGMPRRTANTITDLPGMLAELERVRARGYAMDLGEEELGVHCLAVGVHDGSRTVAAMSVSGPAERIETLDREELAEGMRRIAGDFGAELGGSL